MELLIAAVSFLMPKLMEPSCLDCSVGCLYLNNPKAPSFTEEARRKQKH